MASRLRQDIESQIRRLLARQLSIEAFRAWHVHLLWDPRLDDDPEAAELAWAVENHFAEWTGHHISEDAFRASLDALVPHAAFEELSVPAFSSTAVQIGSFAVVLRRKVGVYSVSVAGIERLPTLRRARQTQAIRSLTATG